MICEISFSYDFEGLVLKHIKTNKPNVLIIFSGKDSCLLDRYKLLGPTMMLSSARTPCQIGLRKKIN